MAPKDLAEAVGSGVTAPEFFTKEDFDAAMSSVAHAWDASPPEAPNEAQLTRVRAATESLRQWSLFHTAQSAFRLFRRVLIGSTSAILAACLYLPFALDPGTPIAEPFTATVEVSQQGADSLRRATGCTDPRATTFLAVEGSWQDPVLAVDGPGCTFGATWRPGRADAELRPAASN